MLVDDEINNLQLLKRTFHRKYNILTASNGLEGLKVFEENRDKIALIVSDHKMPIMEGTEFLEKVNWNNKEAFYMLGVIYGRGLGVPADIKKGVEYFQKCQNYAPAQEALLKFKKTLFGKWVRR